MIAGFNSIRRAVPRVCVVPAAEKLGRIKAPKVISLWCSRLLKTGAVQRAVQKHKILTHSVLHVLFAMSLALLLVDDTSSFKNHQPGGGVSKRLL